MALKILLLQNLPIAKEHGAREGRVFDCIRRTNEGRGGKMAWFIGDAGKECAAFEGRECFVSDE